MGLTDGQNKESTIKIIKEALGEGLKVNFGKSRLYVAKQDAVEATQWSKILGCHLGEFPLNYLGATLGSSPKKSSYWRPLVKKVRTKLTSWRCSTLSKAGRLVLIKSVLESLPAYWVALFKPPKETLKNLEKISRQFFWGECSPNKSTRRKLHTIKWEVICRPKKLGGLGVQVLA